MKICGSGSTNVVAAPVSEAGLAVDELAVFVDNSAVSGFGDEGGTMIDDGISGMPVGRFLAHS